MGKNSAIEWCDHTFNGWILAYSAHGEALLERFNFFRVQNAAAMPDHVPLFCLELDNRERFLSILEERGLDLR
jgi:hypothetical protein